MSVSGSGLGYVTGGRTIVRDLEIEAGPGEVVALVGPNGAGKTTALSLLAGDLDPTSGSVTMGGQPIMGMALADLSLMRAVLPAQANADIPFTVREVVELGRRPHGDQSAGGGEVIDRCLAATDVQELGPRVFRELSTGEQARVTLARILAQETPVLLLDEPTGSLDVKHAALVMRTLRDTARGGAAIVAVLHDLNLAAQHADKVVVLDRGEIAASGPPDQVLTADLLTRVYEHPVQVIPHPFGGSVLIVP